MDLADTISTSSLCLSDKNDKIVSTISSSKFDPNKNKVGENQFDEFKTKKNSGLAITANEWCGRAKQTCSEKRKNNGLLTLSRWLPILLCLYALLKEIKVGEPFLFVYQNKYLNITKDQLRSEIYPFAPYAYLITLIPLFLLTDLLLYKPSMIMEMIGQIGFRSSLVFGRSVLSQIIGQIFYGIASASEIAFFSYTYARLEKDQYRKLTSWTRACTMAGRTFGYFFSQLFIQFKIGTLRSLNIISFVMPCITMIFCIFLPRVHWKTMVARMLEAKGTEIKYSSSFVVSDLPKNYIQYSMYRVKKLKSDFCTIYQSGFIRKWSLWWAMTTCMSLQVALYSQTLWGEIKINNLYNGYAEAFYTATALAILGMNAFPLDWDKWGEVALVIISTIDAVIILIYSKTESIFVMYGCYICYRSLYQVMITIAQWNIAKKMICESYGLVFGTNSFVALILQSLLTYIVSDKKSYFSFNIRFQYVIYAGLHFGIAAIFFCSVLYNALLYFLKNQKIYPIIRRKLSKNSIDSIACKNDQLNEQNNNEEQLKENNLNDEIIEEAIEKIQLKQQEISDGVDT